MCNLGFKCLTRRLQSDAKKPRAAEAQRYVVSTYEKGGSK